MTDPTNDRAAEFRFGSDEPPPDLQLRAQLHILVGDLPMADVDWSALAARIARATTITSAPWWCHAVRLERRLLPLALAAGLAGALALWRIDPALPLSPAAGMDLDIAVMTGVSTNDAARTFAGSVTSSFDLTAEPSE